MVHSTPEQSTRTGRRAAPGEGRAAAVGGWEDEHRDDERSDSCSQDPSPNRSSVRENPKLAQELFFPFQPYHYHYHFYRQYYGVVSQ